MKKFILFLVIVCLSSCTFYHMNDNLRALHGQSINSAIQVLGLPDGKYSVAGMMIYVWGRSESYSYDVPRSSTTYGNVGGLSGMSFNATTDYRERHYGVSNCRIKIATQYGRIVHTEYDGSMIACEPYADRLQNAFGR